MTIDANLTTILLAIIAMTGGSIITPIITHILKSKQDKAAYDAQERRDAAAAIKVQQVAVRVEDTRKDLKLSTHNVDGKLDGIHELVNDQLSRAVKRFEDALVVIEELKDVLRKIRPNDPLVKEEVKEITEARTQ
jgi:hypothetical protein